MSQIYFNSFAFFQTLQNFMYTMLRDPNETAAKMSLVSYYLRASHLSKILFDSKLWLLIHIEHYTICIMTSSCCTLILLVKRSCRFIQQLQSVNSLPFLPLLNPFVLLISLLLLILLVLLVLFSQDVMIELYRKNIWNDAKTVNVIVTALTSKVTKVRFIILCCFTVANR